MKVGKDEEKKKKGKFIYLTHSDSNHSATANWRNHQDSHS